MPIEESRFRYKDSNDMGLREMAELRLFGNLGERVVNADSQFTHLGINPDILVRRRGGVISICNNILANILYLAEKNGIRNAVIVADPRFVDPYNGVYRAFTIWPGVYDDTSEETGEVLLYPDEKQEDDERKGWRDVKIMYCTTPALESRFGCLAEEIKNSDGEDLNSILKRVYSR